MDYLVAKLVESPIMMNARPPCEYCAVKQSMPRVEKETKTLRPDWLEKGKSQFDSVLNQTLSQTCKYVELALTTEWAATY